MNKQNTVRKTVLGVMFMLGLGLALPEVVLADPPSWAPAHGYRNKHKTKHKYKHSYSDDYYYDRYDSGVTVRYGYHRDYGDDYYRRNRDRSNSHIDVDVGYTYRF